jgi:hypothetical protein
VTVPKDYVANMIAHAATLLDAGYKMEKGSGFRIEPNSPQTHNVPATLPGDPGYSPLWLVWRSTTTRILRRCTI